MIHTCIHRVASASCSFAQRPVIYNHEYELAYYLIVCFHFKTIRQRYTFHTHIYTQSHSQLQHEWGHWAQPGLGYVYEHLTKKYANHGSSAYITGGQRSTGLLLEDKHKEILWCKQCGKYHWNCDQESKEYYLTEQPITGFSQKSPFFMPDRQTK